MVTSGSSPQLGVAVRAAETGAVVNVLIGHQPLQRIDGLQTGHTGLPHRQTEALQTHATQIQSRQRGSSSVSGGILRGLTLGVLEDTGVPVVEPVGITITFPG